MSDTQTPTSVGLDEFVSVPDLAEAMNLSRQNVYDRIKAGRLDAIVLGPRAKIVRKHEAITHFRAEAEEHARTAERLFRGIDYLEGKPPAPRVEHGPIGLADAA